MLKALVLLATPKLTTFLKTELTSVPLTYTFTKLPQGSVAVAQKGFTKLNSTRSKLDLRGFQTLYRATPQTNKKFLFLFRGLHVSSTNKKKPRGFFTNNYVYEKFITTVRPFVQKRFLNLRSFRLENSVIFTRNPNTLLYSIIGINVAVFLLWQSFGQTSKGRKTMYKNFVASIDNIKQGRLWTALTNSFSHEQPFHLLVNMLVLYFLGKGVLYYLGPTKFLTLYLASGLAAVAGHLMWPGSKYSGVHGASGSIMAISVLYAGLWPNSVLLLYGLLPVKAWIAVCLFIGWDLISLNRSNNVSNAGHLAGAAAGLLYLLKLKRFF